MEPAEELASSRSVDNGERLAKAYDDGLKMIMQITSFEYTDNRCEPLIGLFDIASRNTANHACQFSFSQLKERLSGLQLSTVDIIDWMDVHSVTSVRKAQQSLIESTSLCELRYLKAAAALESASRGVEESQQRIVLLEENVEESQQRIVLLEENVRNMGAAIQTKDDSLRNLRAVVQGLGLSLQELITETQERAQAMQANENRIQSLEAENQRLGSQNARLERHRLTGDRLNQGSAAELGTLVAKITSEIERLGKLGQEAEAARVERAEEEKKMEEACMACGDKKRSVKLPCGHICYCQDCYEHALAVGRGEADDVTAEPPRVIPKCPTCNKPFSDSA